MCTLSYVYCLERSGVMQSRQFINSNIQIRILFYVCVFSLFGFAILFFKYLRRKTTTTTCKEML